MANQINIISAIELSAEELKLIQQELAVKSADTFFVTVDPTLIAGMKISVNGKAVDLSIKQQLAEIAQS